MRFVVDREVIRTMQRAAIFVVSGTVALATSGILNIQDSFKTLNTIVQVLSLGVLEAGVGVELHGVSEIKKPEPSDDDPENLTEDVSQILEVKWENRLTKLNYFKLTLIPYAALLNAFDQDFKKTYCLDEIAFGSFAVIFAVEASYFRYIRNYLDMGAKIGMIGASIGSVAATALSKPDYTSYLWYGGTSCALFLTLNKANSVRKARKRIIEEEARQALVNQS
ncbi:MAG: hypothetical protein JSR33_04580 [Proteobacteria bacterium]|nr:hypothetical protein [Pseudomonadota bacterium]